MAKPKTALMLAQALISVGLPAQGVAKLTAALIRALDARGMIVLPHSADPDMLGAAVRIMRHTGYIVGSSAERKVIKQSLRYRAMVETERERLGVAARGRRP